MADARLANGTDCDGCRADVLGVGMRASRMKERGDLIVLLAILSMVGLGWVAVEIALNGRP